MSPALDITTRAAEETRRLGRLVGEAAWAGELLLLEGELGAGKTCFIQGLALGLGIAERVVSPSFVLVREYRGRLLLYHIDLYRLEMAEVADLGLEEYLEGDGVVAVEWAERGMAVFPADHLLIEMFILSENERRLRFSTGGGRHQQAVDWLAGALSGR